jgi:iron complex transport system permease protein
MQKQFVIWVILIFLMVLLAFADIFIGSVDIRFNETLQWFFGNSISENYKVIITEFRIPKMITAIFTGIALSISGLQMQTVFKNPLAGPYILGISAGAGLGVSILLLSPIAIYAGSGLISDWLTVIFAWIGAGTVIVIIFGVSIRIKNIMTVLIIGVLISSAISSVINILQYFSEQSELKSFVLWSMGSLSGITREQLPVFLLPVILGLLIAYFSSGFLNVYLLGDNYAITSGLNLFRTRSLIFLSTGLLTGTVTAFCGPIGFIGIIVPHLARMVFKSANHKLLIPGSALIGAIFLLASDIISMLPGYTGTLPINSVTSILGIPIVIKIVLRTRS